MSTAILSEEPYVFFKKCPRRTVRITVCGVCVCVCGVIKLESLEKSFKIVGRFLDEI